MAEPFIHHLHIIYAELNYTYINMYNLKAYLQLKSINILKTNKQNIKLKFWFIANKLK